MEPIKKIHCENCGQQLVSAKLDATELERTCTQCGTIKYYNPIPVMVALIPVYDEENDKTYLLGVRRNIIPYIGELAFPGGFQEIEPTHEALIREVREETGIDLPSFITTPKELGHTVFNDTGFVKSSFPIPNRVLVFFTSNITLNLKDIDMSFKSKETQELVLLSSESKLCFSLHQDALYKYFAEVAFYENGHGF